MIFALRGEWARALWLLCLAAGMTCAQASDTTSSEPPPAGLGGNLVLTDDSGHTFDLSKQDARPSLLFFGFTQCTQVCSPAVALMQAVAERTRMLQRAPRLIFVSLDPLNDGPAQLRAFKARLQVQMVGLTGSPESIDLAARRFGVGVDTSAGVLDHSARIYLLNARHEVVRVYRLSAKPETLARDVASLQRFGASTLSSAVPP